MDEDVEFRDMVLKKMEENGSLLNIKAKIRANLYDVIESDGRTIEVINDSDLTYNGDRSVQEEEDPEVDDRTLALGLVHELLESLKLGFTKRVLLAEAGIKKPYSRDRLLKEISEHSFVEDEACDDEMISKEPVLYRLIQRCRRPDGNSEISQVSRENSKNTTTEET